MIVIALSSYWRLPGRRVVHRWESCVHVVLQRKLVATSYSPDAGDTLCGRCLARSEAGR